MPSSLAHRIPSDCVRKYNKNRAAHHKSQNRNYNLTQGLAKPLRRERHLSNVYNVFYYFLILFLQLWYICPIVRMGKLKLREVRKLAHSYTVKEWRGQESHPGVSDPTPGAPVLPPHWGAWLWRWMFSHLSPFSRVLSPSFLLFLKSGLPLPFCLRWFFFLPTSFRQVWLLAEISYISEIGRQLLTFTVLISNKCFPFIQDKTERRESHLQRMAFKPQKFSPGDHLPTGAFLPNNDMLTRTLLYKSHSISVHYFFFASFYLQNLSPTHIITFKNVHFFKSAL